MSAPGIHLDPRIVELHELIHGQCGAPTLLSSLPYLISEPQSTPRSDAKCVDLIYPQTGIASVWELLPAWWGLKVPGMHIRPTIYKVSLLSNSPNLLFAPAKVEKARLASLANRNLCNPTISQQEGDDVRKTVIGNATSCSE